MNISSSASGLLTRWVSQDGKEKELLNELFELNRHAKVYLL
jgi:hypothetical protein